MRRRQDVRGGDRREMEGGMAEDGRVTRDELGLSAEAGSPGIGQDEEHGVHPRDQGALRATGMLGSGLG